VQFTSKWNVKCYGLLVQFAVVVGSDLAVPNVQRHLAVPNVQRHLAVPNVQRHVSEMVLV
jgi:hypothetical protein